MKKFIYLLLLVVIVFVFLSCLPKEEIKNEEDEVIDLHPAGEFDFMKSFNDSDNWTIMKNAPVNQYNSNKSYETKVSETRSSMNIEEVIYASGYSADQIMSVYSDGEFLYMSGRDRGYSFFKWEDYFNDNLKGNLSNVQNEYDGEIPGNADFVYNQNDGVTYAWIWDRILEAKTGEEVLNLSEIIDPDQKYSFFRSKFLIDRNNNIWLGSSSVFRNESKTGLYKIPFDNPDNYQKILEDKIHQVYMDTESNIWVITNKAVYRYLSSDNYTSKETYFKNSEFGLFGEDIIEYNGKIYIISKDFFENRPRNPNYDMYKFEGSKFNLFIDFQEDYNNSFSVRLFEYEGSLYSSNFSPYLINTESGTYSISNISNLHTGNVKVFSPDNDDILVTCGNSRGLKIFYNNTLDLLEQVETAEGLASNNIKNIYYDKSTEDLFFSHSMNGYTYFENGGSFEPVLFSEINQYDVLDFYRYQDEMYVYARNRIFNLKDIKSEENVITDFTIFYSEIDGDSYGTYPVKDIFVDENNVWSYSGRGVINYYDHNTGEIYTNDSRIQDQGHLEEMSRITELDINTVNYMEIEDLAVNDIISIGENTVLLGGDGIKPLQKYNYNDSVSSPVDLSGLNINQIDSFEKGSEEKIYIISSKEIYTYSDDKLEKFINIESGDLIKDSLLYEDFLIIVNGKDDYSSYELQEGIEVVNLKTKENQYYSSEQLGLPIGLTKISVSHETKKDVIWIGTENGLVKINITE